jgi:hypothetical protein
MFAFIATFDACGSRKVRMLYDYSDSWNLAAIKTL